MTDEKTTLKDAVEARGPLAVWDLMTEDEKKTAAAALWVNADRESRMAVEMMVAKEMKFRPQSVRKLSAEQVAPRLARLAAEMPETAFFQFLFHFHMAEGRELMVEYLDAVGLPHEDGVLDLPDGCRGARPQKPPPVPRTRPHRQARPRGAGLSRDPRRRRRRVLGRDAAGARGVGRRRRSRLSQLLIMNYEFRMTITSGVARTCDWCDGIHNS